MTKKQCPLGENCDLTTAWMAGAAKAQDHIKAQAAEIERLAEDKRWIIDERDRTFALMLSRAEEAEAEIERLRGAMAKLIGGSETVLEAWDHHMRDVVVPGSLHDAIEELRADVVEATTVSATVKDYLTTEDEKQSHEWKCPIDYPGCRKNCGSPYGCKK